MALRKLQPLTIRPAGLSDARDGTNAFRGAMSSLANLVPAPDTAGVWLPRSASRVLTSFAGFTDPGIVSALKVIGTKAYGFIQSQRFPGYDEPFCYDIARQQFYPIAGVNANNLPRTVPSTGDWIPPTISAVTNARILFTHPGFTPIGIYKPFFGWLDISNFTIDSLLGNTTNGSPTITSINDGFSSAPIADGVAPGMTITGPGIPANTTVLSLTNGSFSLTTTCNVDGSYVIKGVANLAGVEPGMGVAGPQIAPASTVVSISGNDVTLNRATLVSATDTDVTFSGGGSIIMSANATATASQVALAIAGGTPANPQWGAGNVNTFPIYARPTAVFGFSGRAWFSVGNALVFSDPLNPTQVTNADQALIIGDDTPITALAGLPEVNTVTGGALQAMIVFKGAGIIQQVTGDAALNNLSLNAIEGSVGTVAPHTICSTPQGLAFIAVDGLRILSLSSVLSDPIGSYGEGVNVPFLNALYPTRMNATYGQNTLRVSFQNGVLAGTPWQEVCYDFKLKSWHGPHSFPSAFIEPYTDKGTSGFVLVPQSVDASLWFHSLEPTLYDTYTENSSPIECSIITTMLPDNTRMVMNRMVQTAVALLLPALTSATCTFYDENMTPIDQALVPSVTPFNAPIWGSAVWGKFTWGQVPSYFHQYRIPWHFPIVFKQGFLEIAFPAAAYTAVGNMYLGYQTLGYNYLLQDLQPIVGYIAIEASVLPDGSFTAIEGVALSDGSFTGILAGTTS